MSRRALTGGLAVVILAGVVTGLWSAREVREQDPSVGPWLDARGRPVPDGTNREQGFPLVLHVYQGHEHCDWQTVTFLSLTWPPGTVARSPLTDYNIRQYVRDPQGILHPSLSLASFDSEVDLPSDAEATGYHSDSWELWLSESQADRYVYFVRGMRAERWPRAQPAIYCK